MTGGFGTDWLGGGSGLSAAAPALPAWDVVEALGGPGALAPAIRVVDAREHPGGLRSYERLRRAAFVEAQGLFAASDADDHDGDEHTVVLLAVGDEGAVLGGVRLHPEGGDPGLGWWRGSRLVCDPALTRRGAAPAARGGRAAGGRADALRRAARAGAAAALVRRACELAEGAGALRFDAHVQTRYAPFFRGLGWEDVRALDAATVGTPGGHARPGGSGGAPHRLMRWPIGRIAALVEATKLPLGPLLGDALQTPAGFLGDDGTPVPGTSAVACVDGILPRMVADDPEWAGWCGMLVTAHDLAAMGARFSGALDALAAPDAAHAERVLRGLRAGAEALRLPILGGHTTLGADPALSVTGLGQADHPVPAGGGRAGDALTVAADLGGGWRPGHRGQWDSSTRRSSDELAAMLGGVRAARPHAAKDVSMAGTVGTVAMLAEASGCGATVDVAAVPRPDGIPAGDWLTCFPGFAMVTADAPGTSAADYGPATTATCGRLDARPGVRLRWPDGDETVAVTGAATGLGAANDRPGTA